MSNGNTKIGVVGIPDGWSSLKLVETFRNKGVACELIDMGRVALDLDSGRAQFGDLDLSELDAIVIKKIGAPYSPDLLDRLAMLRCLHESGLPIFSAPFKIKRVLGRLSCTVTLRVGEIPMPPTVITEDIDQACRAIEKMGKAVLKPLYTSKARGMRVVEAGNDVHRRVTEFHDAGNEVIYVQKMLTLPGRDLGLVFLGGQYVGCYARAGDGRSWNTTTRSGGKYQPHEPSEQVIALARKAQDLFELDFTCVDIAESDEGLMVFEVSAFGGFRGLMEANGIDAADLYSDYVLKKISL